MQCQLGVCYQKGLSVATDEVEVIKPFTHAGNAGKVKANLYLFMISEIKREEARLIAVASVIAAAEREKRLLRSRRWSVR